MDETIIITRSNKRPTASTRGRTAPRAVRRGEIGSERLCLMIVKNNYHYTGKQQQQDRQENPSSSPAARTSSPTATRPRLRRIRRFEDFCGFRFAQASLVFPDYDDMGSSASAPDTLSSESPALTREQSSRLFFAVAEDYADIPPRRNAIKRCAKIPTSTRCRSSSPMPSPATRRKADNGAGCFVDRMLFGEETISRDLLRWLDTVSHPGDRKVVFCQLRRTLFEDK